MASGFETHSFQFTMLFLGPVICFLWACWELMAPISVLRFMYAGMSHNDPALFNTLLFYTIRTKGILLMMSVAFFWLALRRANNTTTLHALLAVAATSLAILILYLVAVRSFFGTNATFGTVLVPLVLFGILLSSLYFVFRHVTSGAAPAEKAVVKVDAFFVWSVVIAPLGFLWFGVWELVEPASYLKFFFPAFNASLSTSWIYSSDLMVLIARMSGVLIIACVLLGTIAVFNADTRTSAHVLGTAVAGVLAHLIAYAEVFDLARYGSIAGPVVFFVCFGGYCLVSLAFLYSFYFLGHKRDAVTYAAPLYAVGTPFEYAA